MSGMIIETERGDDGIEMKITTNKNLQKQRLENVQSKNFIQREVIDSLMNNQETSRRNKRSFVPYVSRKCSVTSSNVTIGFGDCTRVVSIAFCKGLCPGSSGKCKKSCKAEKQAMVRVNCDPTIFSSKNAESAQISGNGSSQQLTFMSALSCKCQSENGDTCS